MGCFSKISLKWLDYLSNKNNIFIQHANNLGEKIISYKNKKYKCDGYCKYNNTIYEFYGDFWHGNPKLFKQDDYHPIRKIKYGEIYAETIERENILKNMGYNVVSIWESEFNEYL